jgi:hypothetical protein
MPTIFARGIGSLIALGTAASAGAQTLAPPDSTQRCQWMAECSAPPATLRMEELKRSGSGRDLKVDVSPRANGFPAGVPLTLWIRRVEAAPSWIVAGYAFDSSGRLGCADRIANAAMAATARDGWCPVPLDTVSLTLGGAMEGEPFAFALSTADGRQSAYAVVVPRPVATTGPGCGTLDAQLLTKDARTVRILGTGFPPASAVTTESVRGHDKVPGTVTTDSTGRFVAVVTSNGRGGDAAYTARTGGCEVTLNYRWGRNAW